MGLPIRKNKIKKYRIYYNMTIEELAEKTGISVSALGYYENHKCKLKIFRAGKIAKVFGISTSQLWEDE